MTAIVDYNTARLVADGAYGRTSQGLHGDIPSGWMLDTSFNSSGQQGSIPGELSLNNGFFAYALKPLDPTDSRRLLAFRGTEGSTDLLADAADIGQSQFALASPIVNQWLAEEVVANHRVGEEKRGHSTFPGSLTN